MAARTSSQKYKIRLRSGRVLGPLDVQRVRKLIRAGHVRGDELARDASGGDWESLARFPELAQLLLEVAAGDRPIAGVDEERSTPSLARTLPLGSAKTQILEPTAILPSEAPNEPAPATLSLELSLPPDEPASSTAGTSDGATAAVGEVKPQGVQLDRSDSPDDRTVVASVFEDDEADETNVAIGLEGEELPQQVRISEEKTVVFQRSSMSKRLPGKVSGKGSERTRRVVVLLGLVFVAVELLSDMGSTPRKAVERADGLRPRLPSASEKNGDPATSQKLYLQGLEAYRMDGIPEYRRAVQYFTRAVEVDSENVRALAMLASSYLNLIDVSNKDETYFSVISKLIELSRAKNVDLTETLIAEVEFLLFSQRPSAAQNKLIEYTRTHKNYDNILFVYLATILVARGDYATAARYLAPLGDDLPFSIKVYYTRGQVAEGLGDKEEALRQYQKAVELNPRHGLARYRILKILEDRAQLKEGRKHLSFLTRQLGLLPHTQQARVYSWRATLEESDGRIDVALGLVERALRLDSDVAAYHLQYYLLRSRAGDQASSTLKEARLFYYLAEGERLAQEGKVEAALSQYLAARNENPSSPLPLVKRGELFHRVKRDVVNARLAYKKAAELAPRDVQIWSKYIELLIQSYEWEEASKAMARFRNLPVPQGIIDKVSADWHARQGLHVQAQGHYRKAMSRTYIEPGVYLAYGQSLLATGKFEEAPFIFSLALRQDPENHEAILGTAAALAGSDGIDRAVAYLQDELQKGRGTRVELLCGIASLLIQKGRLDPAAELIEQAKRLRPDASRPWRVEAELNLARGADRKFKTVAAEAYRAYLDRNPSDATMMYERYRVLVDLERYEEADHELGRIYESYPKFPSLHFSKGLIYMRLANYKAAIREFEQELKNGNTSTQNLVELGKAHLELRDAEKALGYFIQAIRRSPADPEPKFQAGRANFALSRYDASIAMYQEALKTDAGNPLIYRHLGYAFRATGDRANMQWAFGKYLEMEPDAADKAQIERNL